uniref:Uncharacterized protein n=1 Tax=Romanomermis culicivorax TaxID=13658 RepID=A0A915IA06_ROMCU
MLVMTPTISFWTLFFQTGSTFVVQGSLMKGRVFNLSIPPDQIILVSSIFVMVLICVLDSCVYPCMRRLHISHSPLRRVAVSMIWGIAGFVLAAVIQLKLVDEPLPNVGFSKYTFFNLAKCQVNLEYDSSVNLAFDGNSPESLIMPNNENFKSHAYMYTDCDAGNTTDNYKNLHHTVDDTVMDNHVGKFVVFWENSHDVINYNLHKTEGGESKLYILFHPSLLQNNGSDISVKIANPDSDPIIYGKDSGYIDLKPPLVGSNIFNLTIALCNDTLTCREFPLTNYESQNGAVDVILITDQLKSINVTLIQPNSVNLLWQIPQYCLLVSGDMLISVSGVEFAYNQASPSMKSVLQAFRLITICAGQIIDMAISGSGIIHDMATEFVFWTIFATAGLVWFFYLAARYQYVDFGETNKDECEKAAVVDDRQVENNETDSWSSTKL